MAIRTKEALAIGRDVVVQVLELDKALVELDALDSRAARGVELRFFGGLKETDSG